MDINNFSNTVGQIYEASLDPDKWPLALESLCKQLNADKSQMLYIDTNNYMISFACSFGFDPFAYNIDANKFRSHFMNDPVAKYGISNLNEVFSDRRVIDTKELHASDMHRKIRQPANMEYLLTTFLTDNTDAWSGICFFRNKERIAFTMEEEKILTLYKPHIQRATSIHKNIAGAFYLKSFQNAVLNNLSSGIIVLNNLHDVMVCNLAAMKVIENTSALELINSKIVCSNNKENSLLHQAIDDALNHAPKRSDRLRIAVKLHGNNRLTPLFAVITQLQLQNLEEDYDNLPITKTYYTAKIPSKKTILITLCSPCEQTNHSIDMLKDLFGLTSSEAILADCLADDKSLKEAAIILGRTVGTLRVQLQSIFEKTDTNRQASLIRLITAIP
jgi:DNA-binding CsgD family transcriptional regulator